MDSILQRTPQKTTNCCLTQFLLFCKAFEQSGGFYHWELGNEPDLYKTSVQGIVRPSWWNESDYVAEWLNLSQKIHNQLAENCPELATTLRLPELATVSTPS